MKKRIITLLLLFLLILNNVNADPFAAIATTGLSFINPTASAVLNGIMCVTSPAGLITCAGNYAQGRITGMVQGEVLTRIAQSGALGQKIVNSISTYNQVKGYLDEGGRIVRELKIDENGKLIDGSISNSKINGEYVGNLFGLEKEDILIDGEVSIDLNQKSKVTEQQENHISFLKGTGKLWIKDKNSGQIYFYENIDGSKENLLIIDKKGDLVKAAFTVGKNGGTYLFPKVNSEVNKKMSLPENARVYYNKNNAIVNIDLSNSKSSIYYDGLMINKGPTGNIRFEQDGTIGCYRCKVNDMVLSGSMKNLKEGFYLHYGSELEKENIKITSYSKGMLITDRDVDTSIYKDFVKFSDKNIVAETTSSLHFEFLEGNKFFNLDNTGLKNTERKYMTITLSGEKNYIRIENRADENKLPLIEHKADPPLISRAEIETGIFKFTLRRDAESNFEYDYDPINRKNLKQTQFVLVSNGLKDNQVLITKEEKTFVLWDKLKQENAFFFDGTKLGDESKILVYNKESSIGNRIIKFADDKVGDSAFVHGGRGKVYYEDMGKGQRCSIPISNAFGYDCIGLANSALSEVYKKPLSEFPSDIRITKKLKDYGWNNYVIEPSSVREASEVTEEIKKIPSGSIVFLMHDLGKDDVCDIKFNCIEYKGKKLGMGHTLIKRNDYTFVNANPGQEELMPRYALEYNKKLEEEGKSPIFDGIIRRGNLEVVENDYLLVIAPPKNKN